MQILAGEFKGRRIEQPKSEAVRPMSQKVRAALFDVIGSVKGKIVLDLYAGSGAVGLEALSRGAKRVVMIEKNAAVAKVAQANIDKLGLGKDAHCIQIPAESWLETVNEARFDVVLADPPYAQINPQVIERASGLLAGKGILVLSHSSKIESPELKSLELVQHKVYGDTALSFYRK